jgi:hypothetical protein
MKNSLKIEKYEKYEILKATFSSKCLTFALQKFGMLCSQL